MSQWFIVAGVIFLLAGCGSMATDSMATGSVSSTMATSGHALAPPAFYSFCARNKRLCSTKGPSRPVQLTEARMRQLRAINVSVNRNVREEPDSVTEGAEDVWTLATTVGDCEDIAILKKKRLLDSGWPASSLLLTVVRPRFSNAGHTVLAVRTDRGDLILDNITNDVRDWSITPYRYYARQSVARQGEWEFVDRAATKSSAARPKAVASTRR